MKLTRGAYATYVDAAMKHVSNGETGRNWYRIGKDIDDMSVDLSPDIETSKNILDESSAKDNGYEVSVEADPYYADPADAIYPKLKDIAMNRKKGGDCETTMLEVIIEDTEASQHDAWIEDVIIKPTSYGGDTSGFHIPFSIYPQGNRKQGKVTITGGVPTFTANS